MQRMRISIDNIALFFALMLALAMGMVPVLAYAGGPGPQKIAPQSAIASAGNNETNEAAVFTSFRSFGEGCEWALDASGALTVRAYQARCPPEHGPGPMQSAKSRRWYSSRA